MQNYQIALIFDQYHDEKAIRMIGRLQKAGVQVLRCTQFTPGPELEQNLRKAGFIFLLLVDDAPFPRELTRVTDQLLQTVLDRDKQLILIKEYRAPLPPDFQGYPIWEPEDGTMLSPEGGGIAGKICALVVRTENKQILYEKLSSLITIDYHPGILETLAELYTLLCREFSDRKEQGGPPREELAEILSILEGLNQYEINYWTDDGQQRSAIARKILSALTEAPDPASFLRDSGDLYCLACILRIYELRHILRASCIETTTGGDVLLYERPLPAAYSDLSGRFLSDLDAAEKIGGLDQLYSPDQIQWMEEQAIRCRKVEASLQGLPGSEALISILSQKKEKSPFVSALTETDMKLFSVAEYLNQGYSLFESLSGNTATADFLRCLKTGFERLKNYCDIVQAKAVSAQCIGSIAQIDQQLGRMELSEEAESAQDKTSLGLKALLGLKQPVSGQYDVFLSYRHEDADIARNVYHYLNSKLIHTFFDKVTLPELSESDYDDAIMNALDHARHFLVIITDLAQLDTYWIKLEMKTFHHEMVEGRKQDSNFIMLVSDRVYDQIIGSNKTTIPLRYRTCEIMRIRDYKESVLGYLTK